MKTIEKQKKAPKEESDEEPTMGLTLFESYTTLMSNETRMGGEGGQERKALQHQTFYWRIR